MNVLEIAKDGWQALGAGRVVANPAAWKSKQVSVNQVAAALGALLVLAKAFGYDLHMDDSTVLYVAGGIFGILNWLFTVVTTDKIGIMGQRADVAVASSNRAPGGTSSSGQGPLDTSMGSQTADASQSDAVRLGSPLTNQPQSANIVGGPGTENGGP